MSSNIRVVDVNEADGQVATLQPIEEVKEEQPAEPIEEVKEEQPAEQPIEDEAQQDIKNDVVESNNEEVKPKRLTQKDKIQCPKCSKVMTIKSFRYSHEKNCQGQITERPVKPQSKPKTKPKPKPMPHPVQDEEPPHQIPPWKNKPTPVQPVQPHAQGASAGLQSNLPINSLAQHYALLQQEYIKQKQEKYNSLCKNMFATKAKKR